MVTGLFLWVLPGSWNIPSGTYAHMQGFFELGPWLFLFLIPAITMRLFSEEYKSSTIELLITRPVREYQIVLGKYLAALLLLIIALAPTLIYFYSVGRMASPVWNIDTGAIWGSYFALLMLGATYTAIGTFASSLTDNQITAFILSLSLSFFFYAAFDLISAIPGLTGLLKYLSHLGMESHYQAFSRGVIDSRDLLYFASVILFFLALTKWRIAKR